MNVVTCYLCGRTIDDPARAAVVVDGRPYHVAHPELEAEVEDDP